ncbi:MAG TPA: hypothetical protein VMP67_00685 [Candidatus Limnocylindria bacterium]|nr:hypothetical protein [Candidatus Limnocylindria bacterium]
MLDEGGVVVRGLAPPGVTVTRDIPFWFDEHTRADALGRWSMAVRLAPGENVLTFRLGSDQATARQITVHYDPQ